MTRIPPVSLTISSDMNPPSNAFHPWPVVPRCTAWCHLLDCSHRSGQGRCGVRAPLARWASTYGCVADGIWQKDARVSNSRHESQSYEATEVHRYVASPQDSCRSSDETRPSLHDQGEQKTHDVTHRLSTSNAAQFWLRYAESIWVAHTSHCGRVSLSTPDRAATCGSYFRQSAGLA